MLFLLMRYSVSLSVIRPWGGPNVKIQCWSFDNLAYWSITFGVGTVTM